VCSRAVLDAVERVGPLTLLEMEPNSWAVQALDSSLYRQKYFSILIYSIPETTAGDNNI
jgi:hypothetical protein